MTLVDGPRLLDGLKLLAGLKFVHRPGGRNLPVTNMDHCTSLDFSGRANANSAGTHCALLILYALPASLGLGAQQRCTPRHTANRP